MEFPKDDPTFSDDNEQKPVYNNLKFGKIGNWFKGTLTDNTRTMPNTMKPGSVQKVFEFKAHGGSFNDIIKTVVQETLTEVKKDEFWSFITDKSSLLSQLKNTKIGDIVGFRFTETQPSKTVGWSDAKIIKIYNSGADPEYQGESAAETQ